MCVNINKNHKKMSIKICLKENKITFLLLNINLIDIKIILSWTNILMPHQSLY
jgi:hypothetical protein